MTFVDRITQYYDTQDMPSNPQATPNVEMRVSLRIAADVDSGKYTLETLKAQYLEWTRDDDFKARKGYMINALRFIIDWLEGQDEDGYPQFAKDAIDIPVEDVPVAFDAFFAAWDMPDEQAEGAPQAPAHQERVLAIAEENKERNRNRAAQAQRKLEASTKTRPHKLDVGSAMHDYDREYRKDHNQALEQAYIHTPQPQRVGELDMYIVCKNDRFHRVVRSGSMSGWFVYTLGEYAEDYTPYSSLEEAFKTLV